MGERHLLQARYVGLDRPLEGLAGRGEFPLAAAFYVSEGSCISAAGPAAAAPAHEHIVRRWHELARPRHGA